MQEMVNRWHKFADALRTLQESSPWFRPSNKKEGIYE